MRVSSQPQPTHHTPQPEVGGRNFQDFSNKTSPGALPPGPSIPVCLARALSAGCMQRQAAWSSCTLGAYPSNPPGCANAGSASPRAPTHSSMGLGSCSPADPNAPSIASLELSPAAAAAPAAPPPPPPPPSERPSAAGAAGCTAAGAVAPPGAGSNVVRAERSRIRSASYTRWSCGAAAGRARSAPEARRSTDE